MKLSIRAYAKHKGVSDRAVRKAIQSGRITPDSKGQIDADMADSQWEENTDVSKQHSPTAGDNKVSYAKVKTAHEFQKMKRTELLLKKEKGELIDKDTVKTQVFNLGRQVRDSWVNWPDRIAALMAAELNVDEHEMHKILEKHVRDHLNDIGDGRLNL